MFNINFTRFLMKEYLREEEYTFLKQCQFSIGDIYFFYFEVEMNIPSTEELTRHQISKILFRLLKEIILQSPVNKNLLLRFSGTNDGYYVEDLVNLLLLYNHTESIISRLSIENTHKEISRMRIDKNIKDSNLEELIVSFDTFVQFRPENLSLLHYISAKIDDMLSFNTICEKSKKITVFIDKELSGPFSNDYIVEEITIYTPLKLSKIKGVIASFDERVRLNIYLERDKC